MQIRSFRESGEPVWANAPPCAGIRLGPDSRRALGPAATPAASTGRTRDRTRPMLHQITKSLPGRRPHVTQGMVQPPHGRFDPGFEPVALPVLRTDQYYPSCLNEQDPQVAIAALRYLAEDR